MATDSRFRYYHRPKDRLPGGNAARNYGFEKSRGEYVQWFDSDDIMLPEFLEKKVAAFTPSAVLTICNGYSADANLQSRKLKTMPAITNLFKQYVLWQSGIMSPSILFRRSFLEGRKLFDENLICAQESEFFPRLFIGINNGQYITVLRGLYVYRLHPSSKSAKRKEQSKYLNSLNRASLNNFYLSSLYNDPEVFNHFYKNCLQNLIHSLRQKHVEQSWFVCRGIGNIVKKKNLILAIYFYVFTIASLLRGLPIISIKKRLMTYEWK